MSIASSSRRGLPGLVALPLLFLASGALGLAYEVLWMRQFSVLFGATTLATTATLSGFFLGMALGSSAFGARSKRWRRPLLAFGLLEIGVGLGALLVQPVIGLYARLYPALYPTLSPFPLGFALVKLVLAMAAVGIPTFCMGGTLPALSGVVAPHAERLGLPVGGLYAVNLLGATLGTLAVPFVLLPRLGVERSYACAVAGSIGIGLVACLLGSGRSWSPVLETPPSDRRPVTAELSPARFVLPLSAASGLCTLALQVLWTRMFALVHENSLYSFALVVVVFLTGLAGGAGLARAGLRRGYAPRRLLGGAWLAAGLLVLASPRLFYGLTGGLAYLSAEDWHSSLGRLLLLAAGTMLPASLGLGMALPLLMEMGGQGREEPAGAVMGRLLAVNTLGAIVGPLLATFLMGPRLGLWWSLVALGASIAVAGAGALGRGEKALAGGLLLAALFVLEPHALPPARVRAGEGERLVSVREGSHGTTAVIADAQDRWITVNNSYVLGGLAAAGEERWQAHLPLLLHRAPRRVAFLGMGTGITAGAALLHPVDVVVALEIVPEVVSAAREDFADVNFGLVGDPRVAVVADDGRHYLAHPPQGFDVIVGDLLVPWRPAEAPLYSQEHFESVRRALTAEGIFCQWLPLYQLSPEQLAILLRTFVDVFPQASLWRGNFLPDEPTLALVGHVGPRPLDPEAIDRRLRDLAPKTDSASPFLKHPAGLWLFLVGPLKRDLPWIAGARRNRDGEPWIELLSPVSHAHRGRGVPFEWPQAFEAIAQEPLGGTPLEGLDEPHRAWTAAGTALARASRMPGETGKDRVLAILKTLPSELQSALGVDSP